MVKGKTDEHLLTANHGGKEGVGFLPYGFLLYERKLGEGDEIKTKV